MLLNKKTRLACAVAASFAATTTLANENAADENIEVIVITASGFEQNIQDAPATISVISAEDLKKKSYTDVTDALRHVAGVQINGGGVEQSISVRGMGAEYTLFLIDGMPVQGNDAFSPNGSLAGNSVNFLPPIETIERIEVIRGPASSLYGSEAMGGVINIITKKVFNEWNGSVTTEFSKAPSSNKINEDGFQTSFSLNAPLVKDTLSLQITGGFQNQEESNFVGGSDSASSEPEFKKKNVGTKLGWNLDKKNTVTLSYGHTLQERFYTPGKSRAEDAADGYNKSIRNSYALTHDGNYDGLKWKSYANYDKSENPTRVNAETGNGIKFDVLTVNTQASYFLDSHTLTGGATYKNEKLEDGATNGVNLPGIVASTDIIEMERYQYSAFLEDEWRLLDDLAITLSGRYDNNEFFGGQFSPKVYAVYQLSDTFTLRGGVTSGFKSPSLRQAAPDFGATSMGGVTIGNPDLTPETSLNTEIGIGYRGDNGLNSTLTVYKTDFDDKIARTVRADMPAGCQNYGANAAAVPADAPPCVYKGVSYPAHHYGYTSYDNIDEVELKGVEHTLDYRILSNVMYRHSYTYTDTEQKTGTNAGLPLNNVAKHMFNASLDWDLNDRFYLWTHFNYRGKTSGTGDASTVRPSYSFVDAGILYRPKEGISLKAGVYNIANKEVTPEEGYASVLDGRRFIFSFTHNF